MRAQVLGFKFIFITGTMALMAANLEKLDKAILVLPAFAAVFFSSWSALCDGPRQKAH